jgi:probable HAF family extracellular repeat protein
VSGDGSVVVGHSVSANGNEAFRWTHCCGMFRMGDLPGPDVYTDASGVSADGLFVVGTGYSERSTGEAFRWSSATGMVGLGGLEDRQGFRSFAAAVSADGSVVVGEGSSALGSEAWRWTSDGGMVGLGDLAGGSVFSGASGISSDGSVVVGYGTTATRNEAFRWTSDSGMVGLGVLNSYFNSAACLRSARQSSKTGARSTRPRAFPPTAVQSLDRAATPTATLKPGSPLCPRCLQRQSHRRLC